MEQLKEYKNFRELKEAPSEKEERIESLTATTQAIYPGFSRWSTLEQSIIIVPTYHGIAARKKPSINLLQRQNLQEINKPISSINTWEQKGK